ncbi:SufD family Fe-S cluster assembly protein [bacterium]|nr:SufD family Fe-S cluster assembly protein [bacterium]
MNSVDQLFQYTQTDSSVLKDPEVAHVVLNQNKVLGQNTVPGLNVDLKEMKEGIQAFLTVEEGIHIPKTVHLCFGMMPEKGVQRIEMEINLEKNSRLAVLAHCVFPTAVDVQHIMNATINIAEGAQYSYIEKHIHSLEGGVKVYPKATVHLGPYAQYKTEFDLLKGRVGLIDIDYQTHCDTKSVLEMTAKINGLAQDTIKVNETGFLNGKGARGVLTSKIAVRDEAKAEIRNKLTASAPYARGHVDCKEIVQDNGTATAIPIVEVHNPKAHITHEAAIGSVDAKQLQTLLSRGLSEDEAVELIIQGLLS